MTDARAARTFDLVRDEDETGISGTGIVAQGVVFGDGPVVLRWIVGEHRSTVIWPSIESVAVIHGHGGRTRIVYREEVEAVRAEERAEFERRLSDIQRETRRQLDAADRRIRRAEGTD